MNRAGTHTPLLIRWIRRAAHQGKSAEQIAWRFHCEVPFVKDICRIAITGVDSPDHVPGRIPATEQSTIGIKIANESLTKFEREATRRGTTAPQLAAQILNIIAADDLFSATLDL